MSKLEIVIGNSIFISEDSDNIVTEFYIKCNGVCFPYDHWTDLTIPVLNMWFNKLINNSESQELEFILYFMDGPYKLDISKDNKMQLKVGCIESRETNRCKYMFECDYYVFLKALYYAFKEINFLLYTYGLHKGRFNTIYSENIVSMKKIKEIIKKNSFL